MENILTTPMVLLLVTIGICLGLCFNAHNATRGALYSRQSGMDRRVYFGILITIALIAIMILVFLWKQMWERSGNEIGDFLAGFFSSLALLWIIIGTRIQATELREQRDQFIQSNITQSDQLAVLKQELGLAMASPIAQRLRAEVIEKINPWGDFVEIVVNEVRKRLLNVPLDPASQPLLVSYDQVTLNDDKTFYKVSKGIDPSKRITQDQSNSVDWGELDQIYFDLKVHETDCAWQETHHQAEGESFDVLVGGVRPNGETLYVIMNLPYDGAKYHCLHRNLERYMEIIKLSESLNVFQSELIRGFSPIERVVVRALRGMEYRSR